VFVALVIQHAMRMRRIILLSVACPALPRFSTIKTKILSSMTFLRNSCRLRKRHEFRRNVIEDI